MTQQRAESHKELHVVVGAGQVGVRLAHLLVSQGYEVRIIRRGAAGQPMAGLTWLRGDATDAAFMDEACRGAAVIYNCANPADYNGWDGVIQPLVRGVMGAASRAGAKLVALDCLYMIGRPSRSPFDESEPMRPCSSKGELRAMLVEEQLEAHARGDLVYTSGRAPDYFGPETPLSMLCSQRFFDRLKAGKSLEYMGDPDLPRSYGYTPDVLRGLAALGTSEKADGKIWHLPVLPNMTSRQLLGAFAQATGHSGKLSKMPRWMFQLLGVFVPMVRGIPEMYYQWEIPYAIDDSAFRETFGFGATPLAEAVQDTLRSVGMDALPQLAASA